MQTIEFHGADELIALIDAAVQQPTQEEITATIKQGLCSLVRSGGLRLPEKMQAPVGDHYARRLLYRSEQHGYSVVAMTWGPEQGTPIHDHSGLWCVEAVCNGAIKVEQFDLAEEREDCCRFIKQDSMVGSFGSAGCLIPPHEYHTIRNASEDDAAVTLHIYGGEMDCCCIFEPLAGDPDWYQRVRKNLGYDVT